MNATRWMSLSEFVKHLGREGIAKVEEDENIPGTWFITWIDTSPAALARSDALKKMERAKLDDESRQRKFLENQIRVAQKQAEAHADGAPASEPQGHLPDRDPEKQPIKIGFAAKLKGKESEPAVPGETSSAENAPATAATDKASASAAHPAPAAAASAAPVKVGLSLTTGAAAAGPARPLGFNALKAASKAASAARTSGSGATMGASADAGPSAGPAPASAAAAAPTRMSAAEQIMHEEMERKRRLQMRDAGRHGQGQGPVKRMRL